MDTETLQKCSSCGCKKLLKLFKFRENTGKYFKTCIGCSEKIKCVKCNYKCSTNSDLKKHIKAVHNKIKDFECILCEFKCSTNSDLKKHIKAVHNKIKDFECILCEFKCSENGHLKRHIKSVHNKIKDFECTLCDYKCSQNGHLQKHLTTCTGTNTSISGLELRGIEALTQLGFEQDYDYIYNCSYCKLTDWSGQFLRPDFRFINHKIIFETDGIQHFQPVRFGGISQEEAEKNFIITQENDKLKNDFCKTFGYKMIRISYKEIGNMLNILHYELQDILDF